MYTLITLRSVPDFAVGYVRDLRVRWAMEEAGQPYSVKTIDPEEQKSSTYRQQQPFGQVPVLLDGDHAIFESGAILRHLGDKLGLMPAGARERQLAEMWLYAALNSVEPYFGNFVELAVFHEGEAWTVERRPVLEAMVKRRLDDLEGWLSGSDYLAGTFSVADIMMSTVLRLLDGAELREQFPTVEAYQQRCISRPAYQKALAAQVALYSPAEAAA
ncbi:glutathione S-transferase [Duganella sp. CF458]|uniref:glutathione S-transferase family protein n=1 Tax=Duganella sp. CF458 TaxID=1884368 RepID=UPI0008F42CE0|nr:glutathione S-transferase family protein [Duganella sp. CF458]SFF52761.1 glutathione S-transferase [Duganella sp. CF458]